MHIVEAVFHPERCPNNQQYPFNLDVLGRTLAIEFKSPVTFFVGDNGMGKSTLLRAMARKCGIFIWGDKEMNRNEEKILEALSIEWKDGPVCGSFFSSVYFLDEPETARSPRSQPEYVYF